MSSRKPLNGQAIGLMLTLCAIWGFQQVVLKAATPDIAPMFQIALRSGIAAILVGMLMLWRKEQLPFADGRGRAGLVVGALFALEFFFVGWGLRYTLASHMAVFLYTSPIFVALGLHFILPEERLSTLKWLGIGMAFVGIVVTFMGRSAIGSVTQTAPNMLLGDFLGLLAGLAWAATTIVIRVSSLAKASAAQTLLYQLLAACVLLVIASVWMGQATMKPTPLAIGSLVFQSLIVSFASFLVWFWLLKHFLASQLSVFSFLTPLFGIGFGVCLLNEPLEPNFIVGAVLVLLGVFIVNGEGWLKSFLTR